MVASIPPSRDQGQPGGDSSVLPLVGVLSATQPQRHCPCPPAHRPAYVLQTCAHTCTHTWTHGPIHIFTCVCGVHSHVHTYTVCPCVPTLSYVCAQCAHMNMHVHSLMCTHMHPSTSSHVCAACACTCADTCPCMSQQSLTVCLLLTSLSGSLPTPGLLPRS